MTASAPTPGRAAGSRRPWSSSAAAFRAGRRVPAPRRRLTVTVLEGSARLGGSWPSPRSAASRSTPAPSLLARRPEGVALIAELGLSGELATGTTLAGIWTRGDSGAAPAAVQGVPADFDELAATGLLSRGGLARAREDASRRRRPGRRRGRLCPRAGRRRLGQELVDRVVEPLLGGVTRPLRGPLVPGRPGPARRAARATVANRSRGLAPAPPPAVSGPSHPRRSRPSRRSRRPPEPLAPRPRRRPGPGRGPEQA